MKQILHIYARVSTDAQESDGTSLQSQKQLGKLKAKELKMTPKIWLEGAKSSNHEEVSKREVLSSLITAIDDGTVKHLYVTEQSRIGRTDNVLSQFRYRCYKNNVKLYIRSNVYDFNNPMDKLTIQIMSAFSEFENAIRKERVRLGKLKKVKKGYWQGGGVPYGYELKRFKDGNKLSVNKKEASYVKLVFEMYSQGRSIKDIQTTLRQKYVIARRGKSFSLGSLNAMIKNTHYIGYYTFTDSVSEETIKVSCPTIITKSLWDNCNKKVNTILQKKGLLNRVKHFALLREFLWCGHCGGSIGTKINPSQRKNYYYCTTKERVWKDASNSFSVNTAETKQANQTKDERWKRGRFCEMTKSLNIPITNTKVFDVVSDIASKSHVLKEQIKSEMMSTKKTDDAEVKLQIQNISKDITRYEKQILDLKSGLGKLETDKYMKNVSPKEYPLIKKNFTDEINDYQKRLDDAQSKLSTFKETEKWVDWVSKFKSKYTNLGKLDEKQKHLFLRGLINRIDVNLDAKTKDHILKIDFKFPVVDDKLQWTQDKTSKSYRVIKGKKTTKITDTFNSRHYGVNKNISENDAKKKQIIQ